MPLCSACNEKYNPTTILERVSEGLLPEGVELYDFGGGQFIAPVPDLPKLEGKFLSGHMAALATKYQPGMTAEDILWLPFILTNASYQQEQRDFGGDIAEDVKRAVALWPTKALKYGEPIQFV